MSEAQYTDAYRRPSTIADMVDLPLRDFTYYKFAWFCKNHRDAFITLVGLTLDEPKVNDTGGVLDFLSSFLDAAEQTIVIPDEYYIYPDTISAVENVLISTPKGLNGTLAVDVYVKITQDVHRLYKFAFVPAINEDGRSQIRLEIFECTSENVRLPMGKSRDVHQLFRNASTYLPRDEEGRIVPDAIPTTPDETNIVIFFDEDDDPVIARTLIVHGMAPFRTLLKLPEKSYKVLNTCKRHQR